MTPAGLRSSLLRTRRTSLPCPLAAGERAHAVEGQRRRVAVRHRRARVAERHVAEAGGQREHLHPALVGASAAAARRARAVGAGPPSASRATSRSTAPRLSRPPPATAARVRNVRLSSPVCIPASPRPVDRLRLARQDVSKPCDELLRARSSVGHERFHAAGPHHRREHRRRDVRRRRPGRGDPLLHPEARLRASRRREVRRGRVGVALGRGRPPDPPRASRSTRRWAASPAAAGSASRRRT